MLHILKYLGMALAAFGASKTTSESKHLEAQVRQVIESRMRLKNSIRISFENSTDETTVVQIETRIEDLPQFVHHLTQGDLKKELSNKVTKLTQKKAVIELLERNGKPESSTAKVDPKKFKWPALPKKEFVRGRSATLEDTNNGHAVFFAADKTGKTSIGKPLDLLIPQYAYFIEGGKKNPAIVIQAEEAQGKKMIGAINLYENVPQMGLISDFEFLGSTAPKK